MALAKSRLQKQMTESRADPYQFSLPYLMFWNDVTVMPL